MEICEERYLQPLIYALKNVKEKNKGEISKLTPMLPTPCTPLNNQKNPFPLVKTNSLMAK